MSEQSTAMERDAIEFSIGDFLRYLWIKRLWLVVVPGLLVCLALSLTLFRAAIPAPVTFYIDLQSIKDGEYPNGAKFSPGDLISPDVVSALRQKYGDAFSHDDFSKGVVVEFGSPLVRPLLQRYELLLANKQLKPNEFDDLSSKLSVELKSISHRGARIQIDPLALSLTRDQAVQLALDIPVFWSKVFIEKYNILLDQDLSSNSVYFSSFDPSNGDDILRVSDIAFKMEKGLTRLMEENRFKQLKTASGLSIADVTFSVRNLDLLYIRPLVQSLQYGAHSEALKNYQRDAELRLQEIEARISGIDEAINSLPGSREARGAGNVSQGSNNAGIQLTDAGVSQLLKLGQQNVMSGFLQELVKKRGILVDQRAKIQFEFERLRLQSAPSYRLNITDATKAFERVSADYRSVYDQAILKLQRDNRFLYSAIGAPTFEGSSNLKFLLIAVFGSVFLGLFMVIAFMFARFVADR